MDGINSLTSSQIPASSSGSRPNVAQLAQNLFAKIDTDGNGVIDKLELTTAAQKMHKAHKGHHHHSESPSLDEMLTKMDANGDGKVTQDEFTAGLQSMQKQDQTYQANGQSASGGASGSTWSVFA